ncbi:MAG: glutamate synthase subunit beta [Verrucomicrobiota bacterium]|nr:glutamate synthase subunit beta [Verrucomicrobiota bacterium]
MKPRAFIDIKRKDPEYRQKEERIKDFQEVEKNLSEEQICQQASRCMDCGIPFCHGSGCPLENLIPEWNELVYRKEWKKALEILLSTNNFPEFTSRICPAACETACTAGLHEDAVTIRQIEKNLIEKGFAENYIIPCPPKERTGKTIAVVGSGPAGLTVADQLNKKGHKVIVFEKNLEIGGLLRYGIPDFKLDKNIISRRIDLMEQEGIVFERNVNIGTDISAEFLLKRYDAVCLACGAEKPRDLPIPRRDLKNIHFAMNFLKQQNKEVTGEPIQEKKISATGKKVIVIGGGDTGSDCVGTAIRQRAESVIQLEIMPEPPETRAPGTPWPQWPYQKRTSSSHKEGCVRLWNIMSKNFEGKNNSITKLNAVKVKWQTNEHGLPDKMKEIPNSDLSFDTDLILLAMGFTGPDIKKLTKALNLKTDESGKIIIDKSAMTSANGVFTTGDISSGPSLVVRAMADGRKVAENIHNFISE